MTCKGPVRFYIEMIYMFGLDFDTDPQCSWARDVLNDNSIKDQFIKAKRIYLALKSYIHNVIGENFRYERKAIERAITNIEFFYKKGAPREASVIKFFQEMYPRKSAYLCEKALFELLQNARIKSCAYDHPVEITTVFVAVLMFIFGYGCLTDPQCSRFVSILQNTAERTNDQQWNERNFRYLRTYLSKLLINRVTYKHQKEQVPENGL